MKFLISTGGIIAIIASVLLVVILIIAIIAWYIKAYNGLVALRERVKNALSQIDVQLQKRFDLVENLVQTVKGYTKLEQGIWERFADARGGYARAKEAGDVEGMSKAAGECNSVLSRLMVVSEQYPELKADKHYSQLMTDLKDFEKPIAYARQFYNDTVNIYNNKVQMFPSSIVANAKGFQVAKYFEIQHEEQREAPKVQF